MKHHIRKMTVALWVWTALMATWAIAGGISASNSCSTSDPNYASGCQAGTALGVGVIIFLWFLGFVVLSIIWFMTRPKDR